MGTRLFAFLRVLRHSRFLARARFNSPLSILKRACDLKTNMRSLFRLLTFLRYAPLFRKEVYKKQDMRLGVNDGFIFSRRDAGTQR